MLSKKECTVKNIRLILLPALLLAGLFSLAHANDMDSATDPRQFNSFYAPAYQLPDPATMSSSAASGKELVHSTYKYLGIESSVRAANGRPYVGNKLACTNCHLADGTQPNASPFIVRVIGVGVDHGQEICECRRSLLKRNMMPRQIGGSLRWIPFETGHTHLVSAYHSMLRWSG